MKGCCLKLWALFTYLLLFTVKIFLEAQGKKKDVLNLIKQNLSFVKNFKLYQNFLPFFFLLKDCFST